MGQTPTAVSSTSITKEAEDIDGLQLTARGGSDDTWQTNALFGKSIKDLEIAAYLNYFTTDGSKAGWSRTSRPYLISVQGTHASLAPGNMKGDIDQWDAQLTMKYKGFKFDGNYIRLG